MNYPEFKKCDVIVEQEQKSVIQLPLKQKYYIPHIEQNDVKKYTGGDTIIVRFFNNGGTLNFPYMP